MVLHAIWCFFTRFVGHTFGQKSVCKSLGDEKFSYILNFEDLVKIYAKVCIGQILGMEVKRKASMTFTITV